LWVFDRIFLLKNTLKKSCSSLLWFPTSILNKVWRILIFLAENLAHGSQKNLTRPKTSIHSLSCQIFIVDHSKTSSFFAFTTCCEILLCNSIAIIHYFWKTKVLNLKNLRVFYQFSCIVHSWKTQIVCSIFVSVAKQPNKHVLQNHARKLRCHLRAHCQLPPCQSPGALPVNELNACSARTIYQLLRKNCQKYILLTFQNHLCRTNIKKKTTWHNLGSLFSAFDGLSCV
jgi:hypothetical protein